MYNCIDGELGGKFATEVPDCLESEVDDAKKGLGMKATVAKQLRRLS